MSSIAFIRPTGTASSMRRSSRIERVALEFVSNIPDELEDGILYISMNYTTAIHKCACGCGSEIVTPLSPVDWNLKFDGVSITLDPSIGNWSYRCQSHYLIIKNRVVWSDRWSRSRIEDNRQGYRELVEQIYDEKLSKEPSAISKGALSLRRILRSLWRVKRSRQ